MCLGECCSGGMARTAAARCQILEDWAVGAVVALAVLDQVLQGVAQAGQLMDFLVQLINVLARQVFHIAAGPLAVLPEG